MIALPVPGDNGDALVEQAMRHRSSHQTGPEQSDPTICCPAHLASSFSGTGA
jgi:hypothetical protein